MVMVRLQSYYLLSVMSGLSSILSLFFSVDTDYYAGE